MGFKFSVNWHHEYIADKIDQVISGKVKNLVINVPPGSGKTELLTNLIARGLARNARSRFCIYRFLSHWLRMYLPRRETLSNL
jgi:hypothetical protein